MNPSKLRDKYPKAVIVEPNLRLPKDQMLKPDSDPTDDLRYMKIFEDTRRAQHIAEAIAAGAKLDRIVHRIRNKELAKFAGEDYKGISDIHKASKATIGILLDSEAFLYSHAYLDLSGTVEEVSAAEELILDKILKTYSTLAYPVVLMPPTIYDDDIIIPGHKVSLFVGAYNMNILSMEMESRAWIQIEPGTPPRGSNQEISIRVFGPKEHVVKAINLIEVLAYELAEPSAAQKELWRELKEYSRLTEQKKQQERSKQTEEQTAAARNKYPKAKIEEPHLRLPKALLKHDGDATDDLFYMKIFEDDTQRAKHLEEAIAAGAKLDRRVYRLRYKELFKFIGKDFEGMSEVHRASKATIGILADAECNLHSHSYVDLVGTVEEVSTAEGLILYNILKTYSTLAYPVILMPPTIYGENIIIPVDKVINILGTDGTNILRMEMESGAWIKIEVGAPPGGSEKDRLINVFGPRDNVNKAIKLIRAVTMAKESGESGKGKQQAEEGGSHVKGKEKEEHVEQEVRGEVLKEKSQEDAEGTSAKNRESKEK